MPSAPSGIEIVVVEALDVFENYYFLLHDHASGKTAAVDCGRAAPVLAALKARDWQLDEIWVTHHHWDHVDGLADLKAATGATLKACTERSEKMPEPDISLPLEGDMSFAGHTVEIMHVPGHAEGHIAFYLPDHALLFSGDCLMTLGCGRLFEGTAAQMHASLTRFAALPPETVIYSGHEYTMGNAKFAKSVDPGNRALTQRIKDIETLRAKDAPTVPSTLADELATNPFLRSADVAIRKKLGLDHASDLDVFTELRRLKDSF